MAIMHPADISKRKHVPSEEKFFNACKDKLNDKWINIEEAAEYLGIKPVTL